MGKCFVVENEKSHCECKLDSEPSRSAYPKSMRTRIVASSHMIRYSNETIRQFIQNRKFIRLNRVWLCTHILQQVDQTDQNHIV